MDPEEIASKLRGGDRRTVARLISLVEDESPEVAAIVRALGPLIGNA